MVVTSDSKHNLPIPTTPNLLEWDFVADSPNLKWARVNTNIANDEGRLYLAALIDLHSRMSEGRSSAGVL